MAVIDGKAEINYGRSFVAGHTKYPLSAGAPPLSEAQRRSLDVLADTARLHGFQLDTQVGDILFVNNLSILHGRSAYRDDPRPGAQAVRHVLRLFLRDQESWPVAPSLKYLDDADMWKSRPESQKLFTSSEWVEMPRMVRVMETKNSLSGSHD